MENIRIRKATEKDLDILHQFEQGVVVAERPFDVTLRSGLIHYYNLTELIHSSKANLVVAELDDNIVASGYARIDKSEPYLRHSHHAYIGFMYVVPKLRGQGVSKMVMAELKKWAKEQNITELRLEVYADNASAIKAYEKLGFTKHLVQMRFGLDAEY